MVFDLPPLHFAREARPARGGSLRLVARGGAHDRCGLERARALGVIAGAAVRLANGRVAVGPRRRQASARSLGGAAEAPLQLSDLLAAGVPLMLDLRGADPRLGRVLAGELRAARAEVLVCSRTWWHLGPLRGMPGVEVMPTVASGRQLAALLRRCDTEPLDGVVVADRLLTPQTAAALAAMARTLMAWPVDSPQEAERLARWGVGAAITARPEALAPALAAAA